MPVHENVVRNTYNCCGCGKREVTHSDAPTPEAFARGGYINLTADAAGNFTAVRKDGDLCDDCVVRMEDAFEAIEQVP